MSWIKKIKINVPVDRLLVFARKQMLNYGWVGNDRYQLIDKNSKYWQWNIADIDNQYVNELIDYIEKTEGLPLRFDSSYLSVWEFGEEDKLPPHTDPDISQSASVVVSLIGRFEVRLNDENTDEILERVVYQPGEAIILNNTVYRHSGECFDGYRLSLLLSVDPKFNIQEWFKKNE
jgi:hypothetical protein